MHPALAADLFEAFEFAKRIAVIVDAAIRSPHGVYRLVP